MDNNGYIFSYNGGQTRVHKMGCKDIKKEGSNTWMVVARTVDEAVSKDIVNSAETGIEMREGNYNILPCTK